MLGLRQTIHSIIILICVRMSSQAHFADPDRRGCLQHPMLQRERRGPPAVEDAGRGDARRGPCHVRRSSGPGTAQDPVRLREGEELCVCDVAHVLGMSVSAASHHLRKLRDLKLLKYRTDGKMAYYSLRDKFAAQLVARVFDRKRT